MDEREAYYPISYDNLVHIEKAIEVYDYNVQYCMDKINEDVDYLLELSAQGDPCLMGTELEYKGYNGSFLEWFKRKVLRKDPRRLNPVVTTTDRVYDHLKTKFRVDEWWESTLKREIIQESPDHIVDPEFKESIDYYVNFLNKRMEEWIERKGTRNFLKKSVKFARQYHTHLKEECLWLNGTTMCFVQNNQKKLDE